MDCDSVYIGQTRRSIATRISEHTTAVNSQKVEKSSVAEHAVEFNHRIDTMNAGKVKSNNYVSTVWFMRTTNEAALNSQPVTTIDNSSEE